MKKDAPQLPPLVLDEEKKDGGIGPIKTDEEMVCRAEKAAKEAVILARVANAMDRATKAAARIMDVEFTLPKEEEQNAVEVAALQRPEDQAKDLLIEALLSGQINTIQLLKETAKQAKKTINCLADRPDEALQAATAAEKGALEAESYANAVEDAKAEADEEAAVAKAEKEEARVLAAAAEAEGPEVAQENLDARVAAISPGSEDEGMFIKLPDTPTFSKTLLLYLKSISPNSYKQLKIQLEVSLLDHFIKKERCTLVEDRAMRNLVQNSVQKLLYEIDKQLMAPEKAQSLFSSLIGEEEQAKDDLLFGAENNNDDKRITTKLSGTAYDPLVNLRDYLEGIQSKMDHLDIMAAKGQSSTKIVPQLAPPNISLATAPVDIAKLQTSTPPKVSVAREVTPITLPSISDGANLGELNTAMASTLAQLKTCYDREPPNYAEIDSLVLHLARFFPCTNHDVNHMFIKKSIAEIQTFQDQLFELSQYLFDSQALQPGTSFSPEKVMAATQLIVLSNLLSGVRKTKLYSSENPEEQELARTLFQNGNAFDLTKILWIIKNDPYFNLDSASSAFYVKDMITFIGSISDLKKAALGDIEAKFLNQPDVVQQRDMLCSLQAMMMRQQTALAKDPKLDTKTAALIGKAPDVVNGARPHLTWKVTPPSTFSKAKFSFGGQNIDLNKPLELNPYMPSDLEGGSDEAVKGGTALLEMLSDSSKRGQWDTSKPGFVLEMAIAQDPTVTSDIKRFKIASDRNNAIFHSNVLAIFCTERPWLVNDPSWQRTFEHFFFRHDWEDLSVDKSIKIDNIVFKERLIKSMSASKDTAIGRNDIPAALFWLKQLKRAQMDPFQPKTVDGMKTVMTLEEVKASRLSTIYNNFDALISLLETVDLSESDRKLIQQAILADAFDNIRSGLQSVENLSDPDILEFYSYYFSTRGLPSTPCNSQKREDIESLMRLLEPRVSNNQELLSQIVEKCVTADQWMEISKIPNEKFSYQPPVIVIGNGKDTLDLKLGIFFRNGKGSGPCPDQIRNHPTYQKFISFANDRATGKLNIALAQFDPINTTVQITTDPATKEEILICTSTEKDSPVRMILKSNGVLAIQVLDVHTAQWAEMIPIESKDRLEKEGVSQPNLGQISDLLTGHFIWRNLKDPSEITVKDGKDNTTVLYRIKLKKNKESWQLDKVTREKDNYFLAYPDDKLQSSLFNLASPSHVKLWCSGSPPKIKEIEYPLLKDSEGKTVTYFPRLEQGVDEGGRKNITTVYVNSRGQVLDMTSSSLVEEFLLANGQREFRELLPHSFKNFQVLIDPEKGVQQKGRQTVLIPFAPMQSQTAQFSKWGANAEMDLESPAELLTFNIAQGALSTQNSGYNLFLAYICFSHGDYARAESFLGKSLTTAELSSKHRKAIGWIQDWNDETAAGKAFKLKVMLHSLKEIDFSQVPSLTTKLFKLHQDYLINKEKLASTSMLLNANEEALYKEIIGKSILSDATVSAGDQWKIKPAEGISLREQQVSTDQLSEEAFQKEVYLKNNSGSLPTTLKVTEESLIANFIALSKLFIFNDSKDLIVRNWATAIEQLTPTTPAGKEAKKRLAAAILLGKVKSENVKIDAWKLKGALFLAKIGSKLFGGPSGSVESRQKEIEKAKTNRKQLFGTLDPLFSTLKEAADTLERFGYSTQPLQFASGDVRTVALKAERDKEYLEKSVTYANHLHRIDENLIQYSPVFQSNYDSFIKELSELQKAAKRAAPTDLSPKELLDCLEYHKKLPEFQRLLELAYKEDKQIKLSKNLRVDSLAPKQAAEASPKQGQITKRKILKLGPGVINPFFKTLKPEQVAAENPAAAVEVGGAGSNVAAAAAANHPAADLPPADAAQFLVDAKQNQRLAHAIPWLEDFVVDTRAAKKEDSAIISIDDSQLRAQKPGEETQNLFTTLQKNHEKTRQLRLKLESEILGRCPRVQGKPLTVIPKRLVGLFVSEKLDDINEMKKVLGDKTTQEDATFLKTKVQEWMETSIQEKLAKRALEQIDSIRQDIATGEDSDISDVDEVSFDVTSRTEHLQKIRDLYETVSSSRNYDVNTPVGRTLLAIEFSTDFVVRENQIKTIQKMMEKPNLVKQLRMGAGKTSMILPYLLQYWSTQNKLPVGIVPESLVDTNFPELEKNSRDIFGQKIQRFTFDRNVKDPRTGILQTITYEDILDRYLMLGDVLNGKGALLTTKESLLNLHNTHLELLNELESMPDDGTKMVERNQLEAKSQLIIKMLNLIKTKGIAVCDEIDTLLDIRKELNYQLGKAKPIDKEITQAGLALFRTILIDNEKTPDLVKALEQNQQDTLVADQIREYQKVVAEKFIAKWSQKPDWQTLSPPDGNLLIKYLIGVKGTPPPPAHELEEKKDAEEKRDDRPLDDNSISSAEQSQIDTFLRTIAGGERDPSEFFKEIAATKEFLSKTLPTTLGGSCNKTYGHGGAGTIPYKGSNTPSHNSQFGEVCELTAYTIQDYLFNPPDDEQVKKWAEHLKKLSTSETPEDIAEFQGIQGIFTANNQTLDNILKGEAVDKITDALLPLIKANTAIKFLFIENAILKELTGAAQEIKGNSLQLPEMFESFGGFTGTTRNIETFSGKLDITEAKTAGTDGEMVLFLEENFRTGGGKIGSYTKTDSNNNLNGLMDGLKRTCEESEGVCDRYRAIIDVGGSLTGVDRESQEAALFEAQGERKKAIVSFNAQNELMVKATKEAADKPLASCTNLDPNDRFIIYDNVHTTGTDIANDINARAAVTIGAKTTRTDLFQGIARMRKLKQGQRVDFIIEESVARLIRETLGKKEEDTITYKDVLLFSISNEAKKEAPDILSAQRKKLQQEILNAVFTQTATIHHAPDEQPQPQPSLVGEARKLFRAFGDLLITTPTVNYSRMTQIVSEKETETALQDEKRLCIAEMRRRANQLTDPQKKIILEKISDFEGLSITISAKTPKTTDSGASSDAGAEVQVVAQAQMAVQAVAQQEVAVEAQAQVAIEAIAPVGGGDVRAEMNVDAQQYTPPPKVTKWVDWITPIMNIKPPKVSTIEWIYQYINGDVLDHDTGLKFRPTGQNRMFGKAGDFYGTPATVNFCKEEGLDPFDNSSTEFPNEMDINPALLSPIQYVLIIENRSGLKPNGAPRPYLFLIIDNTDALKIRELLDQEGRLSDFNAMIVNPVSSDPIWRTGNESPDLLSRVEEHREASTILANLKVRQGQVDNYSDSELKALTDRSIFGRQRVIRATTFYTEKDKKYLIESQLNRFLKTHQPALDSLRSQLGNYDSL